MRTYYIYRITNLINGKTYIGQRKCRTKRPETDTYMGSGLYIKRAEKKYGMENFKKEILAKNVETKEMIDELEISYIKYERMKAHYGLISGCYNIADGGGGNTGPCSDETRAKISYNSSHISDETRAKMSTAHKGRHRTSESIEKAASKNRGQHRTAETREKMSAAMKGKNKGKHIPAETKAKLSTVMKGKNKGKHYHLDENGKRVYTL